MPAKKRTTASEKELKATVKKLRSKLEKSDAKAAHWKKKTAQQEKRTAQLEKKVGQLEKASAKSGTRVKKLKKRLDATRAGAAAEPAAADAATEELPELTDESAPEELPELTDESAPEELPELTQDAGEDADTDSEERPDSTWTVVQLRAEARARGLTGLSNKSKAELLDALG